MAFLDYFQELEDPRSHINRTHDLLDVLFLTIAAMMSGAEGWQDIRDFGLQKEDWLKQYRSFEHGIPVDDTIARIISRLNPDKFVECFLNWSNSLRQAQGKEIINIDGKTLRRSFKDGDRTSALHLISVWASESQLVLGQFKSQGKKNEINTVMELLDLIDIKDATVTLDAMGTQKKIAKKIRSQGGDYVPVELVLSLTLLVVLLLDPLSSLSAGFWLSFLAVAVILFYVNQHSNNPQNAEHENEEMNGFFSFVSLKARIFRYTMIPIVVFVGLIPISLLFFERFSLLSPFANILAVPWMSLVIIPMSLLAALISLLSVGLASVLFSLVELLMQPLWYILTKIADSQYNLFFPAAVSTIWIVVATLGVFLLLSSGTRKKRGLGGILIIPLFIPQSNLIENGQFTLSSLDVGQGLALVLRTRQHILIYDTGNAYSDRFNMADLVIIPYMRHLGLDKIDTLVLSHADDDHVGAAKVLIDTYPPQKVVSGEVSRLKNKLNIDAQQCRAGQQWQWDGVTFKFISPALQMLNGKKRRSNNFSCVLLVKSSSGFSALFMGDAESLVEERLKKENEIKDIDVVIVGHHGSKSSSTKAFVEWLNPKVAVFTYGYNNRYNFPAEEVRQRFRAQNSLSYATINGTIDIGSNMSNNAAQIKEYRRDNRHYWNRAYISLNKL